MQEEYSDDLVYRMAELVVKKKLSVQKAALMLTQEGAGPISRQAGYKLVAAAFERSFVRLFPPVQEQLANDLAEAYPENVSANSTFVVATRNRYDTGKVSVVAAQQAVELCREIARDRKDRPVGIGLGPGRATLDFCQEFSKLIQNESSNPKLALYAITAGGPADEPEYASSSFFNLFPREVVQKKIALFAETVVSNSVFKKIQTTPGVKEVFEAKERREIDLVVTSMGDILDEHDLLGTFLRQLNRDPIELSKSGWVGNVQYRPYSQDGAIREAPEDPRAVTLFELDDLAELARTKGKHVMLIARQCARCERTRAAALRPLLTNPRLKVFSRLVLDVVTAKELLATPTPPKRVLSGR